MKRKTVDFIFFILYTSGTYIIVFWYSTELGKSYTDDKERGQYQKRLTRILHCLLQCLAFCMNWCFFETWMYYSRNLTATNVSFREPLDQFRKVTFKQDISHTLGNSVVSYIKIHIWDQGTKEKKRKINGVVQVLRNGMGNRALFKYSLIPYNFTNI